MGYKSLSEWFSLSHSERAFWIGHFEKYPPNYRTDYLLALLFVQQNNMNTQKKSDKIDVKDVAPWLMPYLGIEEKPKTLDDLMHERAAAAMADLRETLDPDVLDAINNNKQED